MTYTKVANTLPIVVLSRHTPIGVTLFKVRREDNVEGTVKVRVFNDEWYPQDFEVEPQLTKGVLAPHAQTREIRRMIREFVVVNESNAAAPAEGKKQPKKQQTFGYRELQEAPSVMRRGFVIVNQSGAYVDKENGLSSRSLNDPRHIFTEEDDCITTLKKLCNLKKVRCTGKLD